LKKNYGFGGMEYYSYEQNEAILKALKQILNNVGSVELDFLGKFLIKLSENPKHANKLYEELEELGY
jgi:hypothetical protein